MKRILIAAIILLGSVLAMEASAATTGNHLLYKTTSPFNISGNSSVLVSGSWMNTGFTCPIPWEPTVNWSVTIKDFKVGLSSGNTGANSFAYTPSVVGTQTYYQNSGNYTMNFDATTDVCTTGSATYSEYASYTLTVQDYKWNSAPTSICYTDELNLNNYISHTSGTSYSGSGIVDGNVFSASEAGVGTHTITGQKGYDNGLASVSFNIEVYALPSLSSTSASDTYCASIGSIDLTSVSGADRADGDWSIDTGAGSLVGSEYTFSGAETADFTYIITENGCSSTISYSATITANPAAPTTVIGGGSYCGEQEITLVASGATSGSTYDYYDASSGGDLVNAGDTWTQTLDIGTHVYYVESSKDGCKSTSRKKVTVTIKAYPSPSLTATSGTYCVSDGSVDLTDETSGNSSVGNWTIVSGNGAVLGNVLSFVSATTIEVGYEVTINGCTTNEIFTATITDNPDVPDAVSGEGSYCGEQEITLVASGASSGSTYDYFSASSGGSTLHTGDTWTQTLATGDHTYYVESSKDGCKSISRKKVEVTVNNIPSITNSATSGTYCNDQGSVNLTTVSGISPTTGTWTVGHGSGTLNAGVYTFARAETAEFTYTLTSNGCASTVSFDATITANPTVPTTVTSGGSYCGSQSITLTASGATEGSTYNYFSVSSGGSSLHTGAAWTKTFAVGTHTYYVETSKDGCKSTTRKEVTITVNNIPSITNSDTSGTYCSAQGSVNLTFVSGVNPTSGTWSVDSGSGSLFAGVYSFSGAETAQFTYTLTSNGCASTVSFDATITANPTVPTTVTGGGSYCGSQSITLTASGATEGSAYDYFSAFSGIGSLHTGAAWTQTLAVGTHTYYVETSKGGCKSTTRKEVTVTVNSIPVVPTDLTTDSGCINQAPQNIALVVSSTGGTIEWWDDAETGLINTGGTFVVTVSTTTTFKAREVHNGCPGAFVSVVAEMFPDPITPTGSDQERCGEGVVTIEVSGITGSSFRWYAHEFSGAQVGNELSYTTPSLTANNTYWFEYTNDNGCILSPRVPVTAVIKPIPSKAVVNDFHRCKSGPVSLSVETAETDFVYDWYEVETGGTVYATGSTLDIPKLAVTKTFYLETTSDLGCPSLSRTTATAYVESTPGEPTAHDVEVCYAQIMILEAAGKPTNGTYRWYDGDDVFLSEGDTYTPSEEISESTTFFVSSLSQYNCESTKDILTVVVDDNIAAPTPTGDQACVEGTMSLSVTGGSLGDVYKWYDSEVSGFEIAYGDTYDTELLTTTTSFWVAIVKPSGCEGPRVEVEAVINSLPIVTGGEDVFLCDVADTYDLSQDEIPTGGAWLGASIVGSIFYGSSSGEGVFTIEYEYTDPTTGCTNSALKTMNVAQTIVVDAGPDIAFCPSDNVFDLFDQSFSPTGGVWASDDEGVNANIDDGARTLNFSGIEPGTYTLTYSVGESGCLNVDQVELTIYATPNEPTLLEGAVCGSGVVELKLLGAADGEVYHWYDEGSDDASFHTGGSFVTATITETATYYVSLINSNGCEGNRIPVSAKVYAVPEIDAGPDLIICNQDILDLTSDASILEGEWSGTGITGNDWNPAGLAAGAHSITYTYTTADGCTTADSRVFTIGLDGDVVITADDFKPGEAVYFETTFDPDDIVTIEWSFGNGFGSFESSPAQIYHAPGIYDVSYTVELKSGCIGEFVFPGAVSIGGDEIDIITAIGNELDQGKAMIYPTVVDGRLFLKINSATYQTQVVRMFSTVGKALVHQQIDLVPGENIINLSGHVDRLPSQLNYVMVNNQVLKILKK